MFLVAENQCGLEKLHYLCSENFDNIENTNMMT